ncbi:N-formylglutamate amidohydrolase [soil metagenome]
MKMVLTCEHAGNKIPDAYLQHFGKAGEILKTHRGYDPGALDIFMYLKDLADFSGSQDISRLLIEMNRSRHHPALFSEFTRDLSSEIKRDLIEKFYLPYRGEAEKFIKDRVIEGEKVLHISIHTFTPVLDGEVRNADVGILYDPGSINEKAISKRIKRNLNILKPNLKVRFNYPYAGTADGFTTYLRKILPVNYYGIEIEVNQKFTHNNKTDKNLKEAIHAGLIKLLEQP